MHRTHGRRLVCRFNHRCVEGVEQFQEKWKPAFRPELRKNKTIEGFCDSKKSRNTLARCVAASVAFLCFPAIGLAAPAVPWSKLPRMELERQFAGPLQDTIIQRWRDPADGTVCYIYLPITAEHSPPTGSGYVQYGPNNIGTISCFEGKVSGTTGHETAKKKK